jgi:hypothetical protein
MCSIPSYHLHNFQCESKHLSENLLHSLSVFNSNFCKNIIKFTFYGLLIFLHANYALIDNTEVLL